MVNTTRGFSNTKAAAATKRTNAAAAVVVTPTSTSSSSSNNNNAAATAFVVGETSDMDDSSFYTDGDEEEEDEDDLYAPSSGSSSSSGGSSSSSPRGGGEQDGGGNDNDDDVDDSEMTVNVDDDMYDSEMTVNVDDDDIEVPTVPTTSMKTPPLNAKNHTAKSTTTTTNTPSLDQFAAIPLASVDSFIRNQFLNHSTRLQQQQQQQQRAQQQQQQQQQLPPHQSAPDKDDDEASDENTFFDYSVVDEETGNNVVGGSSSSRSAASSGNNELVVSEMYDNPSSYFSGPSSITLPADADDNLELEDSYTTYYPSLSSAASSSQQSPEQPKSHRVSAAAGMAELVGTPKRSGNSRAAATPHGANYVVDRILADDDDDEEEEEEGSSNNSKNHKNNKSKSSHHHDIHRTNHFSLLKDQYNRWMIRNKRTVIVVLLLLLVAVLAVGVIVGVLVSSSGGAPNDDASSATSTTPQTTTTRAPPYPTTTTKTGDDEVEEPLFTIVTNTTATTTEDENNTKTTTKVTPMTLVVQALQQQDDDVSLFLTALPSVLLPYTALTGMTVLVPTDSALKMAMNMAAGSISSTSNTTRNRRGLRRLQSSSESGNNNNNNNNNNNSTSMYTDGSSFALNNMFNVDVLDVKSSWSLHVQNFLLHHIVENEPLFTDDLRTLQFLTMANGQQVPVTVVNKTEYDDDDTDVNNAMSMIVLDENVTIQAPDLVAAGNDGSSSDNIVVHVINGILRPQFLSRSVWDVIMNDSITNPFGDSPTTIFVALLVATGLYDELLQQQHQQQSEQMGWTVLVPTNRAFDKVPPGIMLYLQLEEGREALLETLRNHIVPNVVWPTMPKTPRAGIVTSMAGTILHPGVDERGELVSINEEPLGPMINILANNGMVHTIDSVLLAASAKSICNFTCPANSKHDPNLTCHVDFDDCTCNRGFSKQEDECVYTYCSYTCPANSTPIVNDLLCYSSFDDCECAAGYTKQEQECVLIPLQPNCNNNTNNNSTTFQCPENSLPKVGRQCYTSISDCHCNDGFVPRQEDHSCILAIMANVTNAAGDEQQTASTANVTNAATNTTTNNAEQTCDYLCPAYSWRISTLDCWSSFDDCICAPTYYKEGLDCVYKGPAPHRNHTGTFAWDDDHIF